MKNAEDRLVFLIREKMKQDPDLKWNEAMNIVAKENPELADRYLLMGRATPLFPKEEDPMVEFQKLIGKKMEKNPSLSYGQAMNQVARENPALLKAYMEGAREKSPSINLKEQIKEKTDETQQR